jgi:hypothetical protein
VVVNQITTPNTCPSCKQGMLLLASQYIKICVDCHKIVPWMLSNGQQPLVKYQR